MDLFSEVTEDTLFSRNIKKIIHDSWHVHLTNVLTSKQFEDNMSKLQNVEFGNRLCHPSPRHMFRPFEWDFNNVTTVIVGQSPYPSIAYTKDRYYELADGLAFSTGGTRDSIKKMTPSLTMIKNALQEDNLPMEEYFDTILDRWADQGILLLNAELTTVHMNPTKHMSIWKPFVKEVLKNLDRHRNVYFILMGDYAHKFLKYIERAKAHSRYICIEHPVLAAREQREWEHEGCFKLATKFRQKDYPNKPPIKF